MCLTSRVPQSRAPERAAALRRAFEQTLKDPGFLAEAEKLQLEIVPVSGDDVAQLVAQVSATPPEVVERVRAALNARHGNK